jgi:hypothetical protein
LQRGRGPARVRRPADGWPPFVLVQLAAQAQQIRGHVVDGDGAPVAGARVWVLDATPFGAPVRGGEKAVAEGLAAGGATRDEVAAMLREPGGNPEERLRALPLALWPWARTDADGAFVLDGLFERSYELRAMRDDNLLWVDQPGVRAGSTRVVLALPADGTFAELRGRVVDAAGRPQANVRVAPMCDAVRAMQTTMHAQAAATRTDEHGRFALRDVPKRTAYLRLDGEGILPLEYGRGVVDGLLAQTGGAVDDVVVTVRVRMHVQVELADAATADALSVADADGRRVMIDVFEGRSRNTVERLPFADGRTPVFVVPDHAVTITLWRGDQRVQQQPLALVPGDVNRLRF